jgi:DNA-binding Lrp family transcriptional regulator
VRLFKIGVTLDMTGERAMDHRSEPQYTHEKREIAATHALSARDQEVVRAVQGDLPLEPDPFAAAARALGMTTDALIDAMLDLQRRGFLRRFAAILRHRKAGFGANGMAVWAVSEDDIRRRGRRWPDTAISHCYQRPTYPDWKYNLFTMIHARKKTECEEFVRELAAQHGLRDYAVLYSTTEYKKVRLAYFTGEHDAWEQRYLKEPAVRGA